MKKALSISVVIPTKNRLESLNRVLASVAKQTLMPKEIIIVDSSENPLQKQQLTGTNDYNSIQIIYSKPSVCLQRNIGIQQSNSDYIFLCDDDIEISENYCEALVRFLELNKNEAVASGLVLENYTGKWTYSEEIPSTFGLINAYVFNLSAGFDAAKSLKEQNYIGQKIVNYYKRKGNQISKSGWPIITNFEAPAFQAPIYGLGASIIRSEILKRTKFDEAFHANGTGDNYDLAISLNVPINVIAEAKAYHHRETINRLKNDKAYYYRINALHYILLKHKRFSAANIAFFGWSLLGKSMQFLFRAQFKFVYFNLKTTLRILFNQPLYKGPK